MEMIYVVDGVLLWAQAQRKHWLDIIDLIERKVMFTHEVRDGKRVDTTDKTLTETKRLLAELDGLIAKHCARNA